MVVCALHDFSEQDVPTSHTFASSSQVTNVRASGSQHYGGLRCAGRAICPLRPRRSSPRRPRALYGVHRYETAPVWIYHFLSYLQHQHPVYYLLTDSPRAFGGCFTIGECLRAAVYFDTFARMYYVRHTHTHTLQYNVSERALRSKQTRNHQNSRCIEIAYLAIGSRFLMDSSTLGLLQISLPQASAAEQPKPVGVAA